MSTDRDSLLRSIRRWLIAIAFLLGVGIVTLANAGYVVSGYRNGLVFGLAGVAGGAVALAATLLWVGSFSSTPAANGDRADR